MSSSEWLGILVTLNNFLHDLAAAFLFAIMLIVWLLTKEGELSLSLMRSLNRWAMVTLTWVVIGGVIRVASYKAYYDFVAEGGGRQVPVLVLKHILLVGLVAGGLYFQFRLRHRGRED